MAKWGLNDSARPSQARNRNRPRRRSLTLHPHGENGERGQQFDDGDMLTLAEGLNRQDGQDRDRKHREWPSLVCRKGR